MKHIILSLAFALSITTCWAQENTKKQELEIAPGKSVIKKVYEMEDQGVVLPKFPGGMKALMEFLSSNIKYPVEAEKKGIEGKVLCSFVVGEDGSVSETGIQRSVDQILDDEAIRVVNSMPKWIHGTKDGFPISVRYILPVNFRLNKRHESADSLKEMSKEELKAERITMPSFPGGTDALINYLSNNVKYPKQARKDKIEGRVVCEFIVEADGSVSNVEVKKSVSEDIDAEAVRVIKNMPKWIPGRTGEKNVRVRYTLPMTFRL